MNNISIIRFGLVLLLLTGFSAHAMVLKIATISPDGTSWMNKMRAGAKEIKAKTGGRVVIKFYPGGVMGNDANVLRKIRIGQLQGGAVTAGSLNGVSPDIDIYGLPYLFSSLEQVDAVRDKMDMRLIKGLEEKGFVSFGFAEGGFSYMMSDSPLREVKEVQQKKVWIPSGNRVGEAVFTSADISPVPLPISDVLTGLQTGLIDTVITSPIGAIALQWHTRVKYLIDVPLTYFSALLVVDNKAFNKIKTADQDIVRDIMTKIFQDMNKQNRNDNIAARQALKNQGIEFISLSDSVLNEWHIIGKKAIIQLEQQSQYSKEIFSMVFEHVGSVKAAH